MPLNVLRLNQKKQHPTDRVVFIKALPENTDLVAEEFLYRVAAICHPILKKNWLSVTTLEEFPANREFVGRNFNNGECIQLVLRSHSGSWLPLRTVIMVMMHELAHNVHMNHSRDFWKVRNQFADEMRALWQQGYTGEGMWGPGREIETGVKIGGGREVESEIPEQLCGGTYRRRRRKRVRGPEMTWAEKKAKRIEKKFGVNGQALGEDVVSRSALQGFKGPTTKSRVAGSKRGRELRAAAALARFDKGQSAHSDGATEDDEIDASEPDEYDEADADFEDAKDIDGSALKDSAGFGLVRVCEDDDLDSTQVKQEMDEIRGVGTEARHDLREPEAGPGEVILGNIPFPAKGQKKPAPSLIPESVHIDRADCAEVGELACKACSMVNESGSLLCLACSNVLDPAKSSGAWSCESLSCISSCYLNPADYSLCGVCGMRREE